MKVIDTSGCKYLGKLQDDQIRYKEMKEKLEGEYLRTMNKPPTLDTGQYFMILRHLACFLKVMFLKIM